MSVNGSTKQKTNTNNKYDPQFLSMFNSAFNPALDALGQVSNDPYSGTLGVGLDPLQQQAAGMAQANSGVGQAQLGQAGNIASGVAGYRPNQVQAGQLAGMDYSQYMNPYLDSVLGSTMGAIDRQRQMALVGNSQGAGAGAWGGSRHGVADSLTNEAALREASSAANNIYAQGFGQAQQAGQFDINAAMQGQLANQSAGLQGAGLNLNAANSIAGFGQTANQLGASDANLVGQFGNVAQQTSQNAANMAYQEFLRQQGLPYQQAAAYGQLAGTVPSLVDSKSTTKTTAQPGLSQIIGMAGNVAGMFMGAPGGMSGGGMGGSVPSDVRLKKDIEHVLTDAKGRNWYDYRYVWQEADEPKQRGVMAQEALITDPHAVSVGDNGYLQVNYEALA